MNEAMRLNLTRAERMFVYQHEQLHQCYDALRNNKKPKIKKFLCAVDSLREPRLRFALVAMLVRQYPTLVTHKRIARWITANASIVTAVAKDMVP
jgi:hypothetical protein